MNLPVKLGLGTIGTAGAVTSVYYGGDFLLNHFETKKEDVMPSWRPLSEDSEFWNSSGSGATQPNTQFSGKYSADKARLLVGTGEDGTNQIKNKDWWNWVFKNKYEPRKSEFKGGFENLTRGAKGSGTDNKSVQEVCESVYKSEKSKVKTGDLTANATDEFKEDQVWILCSAVGTKPKTVADLENASNSEDKNKLESDWKDKLGSTKKADLLAIYDSGNTKVWEELNKQYKVKNPTEGFFKLEGSSSQIKNKCEEAYKKSSVGNNDSEPKEDPLYKWCSLKGKKASS